MNATNDVIQSAALESSNVDDIMGSSDSSTCPAITFDTSTKVFPHVKTIDYGSGCMGKDSVMRTGEKIVTIYAKRDSSCSRYIDKCSNLPGFYD